jgi:hypothetical protein
MEKGNDLQTVDRTLEQLRRNGIQAGVTWFIGFPTETEEQADETFDFIEARRDCILVSTYGGTMGVGTDMIVYQEQEQLGIEVFKTHTGEFDYRYKDGRAHYDYAERDAAFKARCDTDLLYAHTYLLYATHAPAAHAEITASKRLGLLLRNVDPALRSEVLLERCPECSISRFGDGIYAYQIMTGQAFEVVPEAVVLWDALAERDSISGLAQRTGRDLKDVTRLVEQGINRGLIRIVCDKESPFPLLSALGASGRVAGQAFWQKFHAHVQPGGPDDKIGERSSGDCNS